jgi:hypothetical protein
VFINWGKEHGILPNKIIGFVNLSALPRRCQVSYRGVEQLSPSVYAIVEDAKYLKLKHLVEMSDLFVPICKDCGKLVDGQVVDAKYYLADVEAFHSMVVVIPDIRGQQNDYFVLKCWSKWKEMFIDWLKDDMEDVISDEEDLDEGNLAPFYKVLGQNWDQIEDLVPEKFGQNLIQ